MKTDPWTLYFIVFKELFGEGSAVTLSPAAIAEFAERLTITRPEATRTSVLDEIEKLIGAVEGRHFAAIGTATSEDDKRRHGTKVAFAMELRAAIRALKLTPSPLRAGSDAQEK